MRTIIIYTLAILLVQLGRSQSFYVGSGGIISINSGNVLYIDNNATIDASGTITVKSSATTSASLLVTGSATGNIAYKRHIKDTDWHLVAAPVSSQSINDFVTDTSNSINTSGAMYAVATYNNSNTSSNRWEYYTNAPGAGNFVNGKGYSTNRTAIGDYTFEGAMPNSDVSVSLTTSSGSFYWSALGNPFPSFLPANSGAKANNILDQNSSVLDPSYTALYFWNGVTPINLLTMQVLHYRLLPDRVLW
ncbi:MAG: hypothetical protein GKR88_02455 [Flavobacteriaceae bacterium]|nr:MAG: hypothetical protein GKR88_02000 [Flavobacteriaceae bacterium]QMU63248.1 MAG: hypothetical protein GKR88_02455 [Flavobacteriaceae bacterium]